MTTEARQPVSLTVGQALHQAIAHHQASRLQEAEHLYRAILQARPNHPDANHNLGVLAMQARHPAVALPHFKAALEADPKQGQYWLSYIDALIQSGQSAAARQVLEQGRERGLQGEALEALAGRLEGYERIVAQPDAKYQNALKESLPALSAAAQNSKKTPRAKPSKPGKPARKPARHQEKSPSLQEIKTLAAMFKEGRYTEIGSLAQLMTERFPLHWFGWNAMGAVYQQMGRNADALEYMQKAAALSPDIAEAHNNLGAILRDAGRLGEAETSYRRALEIKPDFVEAHSNLANILRDAGRLDEAETSYRRALEIKPNFVQALNNLASLLNAQGRWRMALNTIKQSLQIEETGEAKILFVDCVKRLSFTQDDSEIRVAMVRALTEPWGRPSDLARNGILLVKLNPVIVGCVARAIDARHAWLSEQDLFGSDGLNTVAADRLLYALLVSAPIHDIEMECFLAVARRAMLEAAMPASGVEVGAALSFYCALARQCFINEYVFFHTDDEIQKASDLRDSLVAALEADNQVPDLWPVVVAAYFPLYSLPLAAKLLERQWPEEVAAVLVQQVCEPEEELLLRTTIPRLTSIEDEVSLLVQNQYECNPYPRWVKTAPAGKVKNLVGYLCQKFPMASCKRQDMSGRTDILIAGCGTGQHPISTAQTFKGAQVLAVDLSMSSLGYAKRKTLELGLTSIDYAQADLLKLGSLGRTFDSIESSGVLHHLADPWAGWKVLLSLLRPGGFMKLGFYSEVARRNIVRVRTFIADQGYGATAHEIRRCRQDLVELDKSADFGTTLKSSDFFSTSACRDLLFHVQEHRMTLTGIDAFLRDNNLAFLGFEIGQHVVHAYKRRFPDDPTATNLSQWQIFENENPDTFFGMYLFWVQKAS